ncbi:MarR family winged helix-turn-helix transcriptional regulator [Modestobacter sp. I12A-02662]|uniref:MarR family winged helix-turn-helix transcriptional regulator n=1 Tax=Modestobacter sp. I12A-02662 TaxID=1730496 RepID=UPI0034DE91A7
MTDPASSAGSVSAGADAAAHLLSDELARLSRVLHALKSAVGSGTEARERAAHVLLFPLTRLGPMRQGALAELVHADPSTVSRHVTLLVDRGLVRRVADEQDGRVSRLVVTPAGEAVLDQMRREREELLAAVTADWSPAELAGFTGQLRRFVDDLTDHLPSLGAAAGAPLPRTETDR